MKVCVKGKGEVNLTNANFVAQGGQASVYQRNGTAYKVYTDPKDAIPEAKFRELAKIDDPNVIRPEDLLIEPSRNTPVGYTMRFVSDTLALCQLFPRAFRERRGVTPAQVQKLVEKLQERIAHVHRAGAVIVDLNELNVLAPQSLDDLFLIDVDSYQTAGFKAEVIMPSVRDWSVKPEQFSALSDWYSFAILAFQLYVGIHPYRGTHAATASLPPDQRLEARMRQNLSALGPGVSLPKACYPLDSIPAVQRAWMHAVLQDGKRLAPPDPRGALPTIVTVVAPAVTFGGQLIVTELRKFEHDVVGYAASGGSEIVLTTDGVFLNGRRVEAGPFGTGGALVGFTPRLNEPVMLSIHHGSVHCAMLSTRDSYDLPILARQTAKSGDRFYVQVRDQIIELEFVEAGRGLVTASRVVANVLESASRLFDGCAIQNMLGSTFVSLFPRSHAGYQLRMPELDPYRIVDAKFDRGVLMVVGAKGGHYDRLVFRFDPSFATYDVRTVPGITPSGLNFIVTHSDVCVHLTEDEKLEVFPAAKDATAMRVIEDPSLGGDMRLMPIGGAVGFARGKTIYTMSLKK